MRIPAPRSTKPLLRRMRHNGTRWWRSILVVQDTPHRVGWGFAIGTVIGWLPVMGIQIAAGGLVSWILRGNVVAAMAAVWVSNPITVIPMYYAMNRFGALFAGDALSFNELKEQTQLMLQMGAWDSISYALETLAGAVLAMFVGGAILGLAMAVPSYFIIKFLVQAYQIKRMERRLRWLGIVEPPQETSVHTATTPPAHD